MPGFFANGKVKIAEGDGEFEGELLSFTHETMAVAWPVRATLTLLSPACCGATSTAAWVANPARGPRQPTTLSPGVDS